MFSLFSLRQFCSDGTAHGLPENGSSLKSKIEEFSHFLCQTVCTRAPAGSLLCVGPDREAAVSLHRSTRTHTDIVHFFIVLIVAYIAQ